jgi:flavin-dependent dehydrogenase
MEYRASLPVYRDVDVVVAGAGPAGIAAAVCAARNKAKVFVFDQWGCVGGMATMGLVGPFMTSFDSSGKTQIIRGVFEELVRRMKDMGGAIHPGDVGPECSYSGYYKIGHNHVGPFDHEAFKIAAVEMLRDSGAELLLHTGFVDVLMENNHINGLVISNKAGISAVKSKVVIDCTCDGDVAVRAGEK